MFVFSIIAAYFAADLFVGGYHLATDRGWNLRQQVAAFRRHHEGEVVFDLKPVFFAAPVLLLGVFLGSPFLATFAFVAGCSELCHYAGHKPERCPKWVRWLQRKGVIISPEAHADHHDGRFDRSFCVTTGWTNPIVDWISQFVPERQR